ncbi:MAG: hypothetical protein ABI321_07410 [Polyangia bacterium]
MKILIGLLLTTTLAWAEPPPKPQRYDFDVDEVQGDVARASGELTTSLRHAARERLIHPRTQFLSELIRSADDR